MAEPSVLSSGGPFSDDSSKTSQTSRFVELQQPTLLSEYPFGEPVEFNWPLPMLSLGLGLGRIFPLLHWDHHS